MKTKEEILAKWRQPLKEETGHDIEKICLLEAMEEYAKAYHEDKTRWISVEERLPEFVEPVFVWCRIYGRYIGTYQQIDGTRFGNWSDGKELGVLPPLFWQPLPTPPKINAE